MRRSFAVLALTLVVAAPTRAAQLVVNTTADTFDGACDLADCSLKDAVFEAENNGQADVIELQDCATYLVTTPYVSPVTGADAFPFITTQIRIVGHGATIQRAPSTPMRFFEIHPTGDLTLEGLTLRDGGFTLNLYGGAILSTGTLVIDNSLIINSNVNVTQCCVEGGAIYSNGGTVQLSRSSFIGNHGTRGGAVMTQGPTTITIDECSFRNNAAGYAGSGSGGAIFMRGATTATIANSTFVGNTSDAVGGAISFHTIPNTYVVDLINLTIVGNTALSDGGGLYAHTCSNENCPIVTKPRLTNVILANNLGSPSNPNCAGGFASVGHNIIGGPNSSCLITGPTNPPDYPVSTLVGLSGIRDTGDGGGIFRPPSATSLPVSNGDGTFCSPLDQLILNRQGASCEVGAIEHRACTPPPAELVNWWPFDELSGTAAYEIAGAIKSNGTYENNPASTSHAMVARAHCFNGVNQRVRVPDSSSVDFQGDCASGGAESFTIDAWVKTCAGGVQPIVDKRESAPNFLRGYFLYIRDGQLGLQLATGPGNATCGSVGSACEDYLAPPTILGGVNLADDRWHHVAVVISRCSNPTGEMYIDGALAHVFTPLTGELSNASDLLIGDAYPVNGTNPPLHGCLDELEMFKRALGASEIAALHDAGWAGKCKPYTFVIGNVTQCLTGLHKGVTTVAKVQGQAVRDCVTRAATGRLGDTTAAACLTSDPDGKIAKATAKTTHAEHFKCEDVVAEFGPTDAASVNAAAIEEAIGLATDVFGGDVDVAIAPKATAPAEAKCQATVVKGYQKLVATKLKVFLGCSKKVLEAGTADAATLASCVTDQANPDSIAAAVSQPGGKVATAASKFLAAVGKACGGIDVATYFPGACGATSPGSLGACIETRVECRVCRMLSHASNLDLDCDMFDDGLANASCAW